MRAEIQDVIDEINSHYARVEQIKRFEILPHELSQEAGELTPTLKIKRNVVQDKYTDTLDAIYRRPDNSTLSRRSKRLSASAGKGVDHIVLVADRSRDARVASAHTRTASSISRPGWRLLVDRDPLQAREGTRRVDRDASGQRDPAIAPGGRDRSTSARPRPPTRASMPPTRRDDQRARRRSRPPTGLRPPAAARPCCAPSVGEPRPVIEDRGAVSGVPDRPAGAIGDPISTRRRASPSRSPPADPGRARKRPRPRAPSS